MPQLPASSPSAFGLSVSLSVSQTVSQTVVVHIRSVLKTRLWWWAVAQSYSCFASVSPLCQSEVITITHCTSSDFLSFFLLSIRILLLTKATEYLKPLILRTTIISVCEFFYFVLCELTKPFANGNEVFNVIIKLYMMSTKVYYRQTSKMS